MIPNIHKTISEQKLIEIYWLMIDLLTSIWKHLYTANFEIIFMLYFQYLTIKQTSD